MTKKSSLWRKEYETAGIPSSTREEPSGAVVSFVEFLRANKILEGVALDLGCGKGRNSIFLSQQGFEVYSIDFVCEAINHLRTEAEKLGLQNRIHTYCQSVAERWPNVAESVDVAIDAFCYKHQVDRGERDAYKSELIRVLKPNAMYLLTLAGDDDGYYGPLLLTSPNPREKVIVDPNNGIPSNLYTKQEILGDFGKDFELEGYEHKIKPGLMHGRQYLRSTHVFHFRKR